MLFSTRARDPRALEARIAHGLEPRLGFRSEVFLRTADAPHAVAAAATARHAAAPASGAVSVGFLARPLEARQAVALGELRNGLDDFGHRGREIHGICRGPQRDSRFSGAAPGRRLGLRCSFRRLSMLQKLSTQLRVAG